jgi:hypothetical protein
MKNAFVLIFLSAVLFSVRADGEKIVKCDNCPSTEYLIVKPVDGLEPIVRLSESGKLTHITTTLNVVGRLKTVEKKYGDKAAIETALSGRSGVLNRKTIFQKQIIWPKKTISDYFLERKDDGVIEKKSEHAVFAYELFFFLIGIIFIGVLGTIFLLNDNDGSCELFLFLLASIFIGFIGSASQVFGANATIGWPLFCSLFVFIILWAMSSVIAGFFLFCFYAIAYTIKDKLKACKYRIALSGAIFTFLSLGAAGITLGWLAGNLTFWLEKIYLLGGLSAALAIAVRWLAIKIWRKQIA